MLASRSSNKLKSVASACKSRVDHMNMCWTACQSLLQNPIIFEVIMPSFATAILIVRE